MGLILDEQQLEAIEKLKNGSLLVGDPGCGKSRTAIAYYYLKACGGGLKINGSGRYSKMKNPKDLYIITTAKKRDDKDWEEELTWFGLLKGENKESGVNVYIDSWNNITKYRKVYDSFFIFDEQRVVGSGVWVKSFLDISRKNSWILLSATPGDTWKDYIPVFVANGFYRNKTHFNYEHVIFSRIAKFPQIVGYHNEKLLNQHKEDISVYLDVERNTIRHKKDIWCNYDKRLYRTVWKDRYDPYDNEFIEETGKLFYLLRKVVNDDDDRIRNLFDIFRVHPKLIIFYNHTYELDKLRRFALSQACDIGEWNGEVHSNLPVSEKWVYLVQYSAGCEGWNCVTTDTIVFYSQSYSYKQTTQAEGRIDRRNTPYKDLYYYYFKSKSPIDIAISRALEQKKEFNERKFLGRYKVADKPNNNERYLRCLQTDGQRREG